MRLLNKQIDIERPLKPLVSVGHAVSRRHIRRYVARATRFATSCGTAYDEHALIWTILKSAVTRQLKIDFECGIPRLIEHSNYFATVYIVRSSIEYVVLLCFVSKSHNGANNFRITILLQRKQVKAYYVSAAALQCLALMLYKPKNASTCCQNNLVRIEVTVLRVNAYIVQCCFAEIV